MSIFVTILIVAAIMCISIGLIAAMATLFAQRVKPTPLDQVYWSFTLWSYCIGLILIAAPNYWFGPSWSYFHRIPHNGVWMGIVLVSLAALQTIVLLRPSRKQNSWLSFLLFLNGFVYWTAGIILGTEGLLGHQGLMESPFMLYAGAHLFTHSAALLAQDRVNRHTNTAKEEGGATRLDI